MNAYSTPAEEKDFRSRYEASGRKLDMGRSCIRFRAAGDLPLDWVGKFIAKTPVDEFIANYEMARSKTKKKTAKTTKKKATRKR